jgi:transcriptional regulator with XRE-family HTH domain
MNSGEIVRDTRQAQGITQAELARRLGITQPSVARLERAGDEVTVATLQRALNAMGHRLELKAEKRPSSVDETLLIETLKLTPEQRLQRFEREYANVRRFALAARGSLGGVA